MYAPRSQPHFRLPSFLPPFVLSCGAVAAVLVLWAAFAFRITSNEASFVTPDGLPPASAIVSVAYSVPRGSVDAVYVRAIEGSLTPRLVREFPVILNWRLRGVASPMADSVALLRVDSIEGRTARLSILSLSSGDLVEAEGAFDYTSPLVWSPSGASVSGLRSGRLQGGELTASIVQFEPTLGRSTDLARFDDVLQVAPVGYSLDGTQLYVAVVNQSGSALWSISQRGLQRRALISPGPTSDWTLSQDGSRLAFVDRVGIGQRTYVGKVLVLATGAVTEAPASADQVGAAWRPGSATPDFGGPGGSLRLTDPQPGGYVIPMRWSPNGRWLVAAVYGAGPEGASEASPSVEVGSLDHRERLADTEGAQFLGWVRTNE